MLQEWHAANSFGICVMNELSIHYTFSGQADQSDMDVTLKNILEKGFRYKWEVKCDQCTSNHNPILIAVGFGANEVVYTQVTENKWYNTGVDWRNYVNVLSEYANECCYEIFEM